MARMSRIMGGCVMALGVGIALGVGAPAQVSAALSDDFESYTNGSTTPDSSVWSRWGGAWVWDGEQGEIPTLNRSDDDYTDWFPGQALFFQRDHTRSAETVDVDLSPGGSLSMDLSLGYDGGTGTDWDGPFERQDADEHVLIRYSTDGGDNWSTLHEFELNDADFSNGNRWSTFVYTFEAGNPVATSSTRFEIRQNRHSGGGYDTWAIDNFQVNVVPLPAAGWAGIALLGAMGGVAGIRRKRSMR